MAKVTPLNKSFCLQTVCEQNYKKILYLIPDIKEINETAKGFSKEKPVLHVKILEQSPYTKTIELSHFFDSEFGMILEPAVKIRLYFDVRTAEVLRDYKRIEVASAIDDLGKVKEVMDYKWRLNYFLEKWLDHCLKTNYVFKQEVEIA
ncbi:MAG: DUF1249 domain-containing protein [Methyloprofundus sp.]|nr:DUF1249 domain-containing protein [Methyloprofundus sp.]